MTDINENKNTRSGLVVSKHFVVASLTFKGKGREVLPGLRVLGIPSDTCRQKHGGERDDFVLTSEDALMVTTSGHLHPIALGAHLPPINKNLRRSFLFVY